ncbi:MAG: hypothetical protein RLZZ305_1114 [Actinomycetota bacterium]
MHTDTSAPDGHGIGVVAFDVDGTLTVRDCVMPFLAAVAGPVGAVGALARVPFATLGARGTGRRDAAKRIAVRSCLGGRSEDEIIAKGQRFAERVARGWMRADTVARLRSHQREGLAVVLVSASLGPYLHPLGDMLEVDAVLCTEVEFSGGVATGEIVGENCRGAEKVRRLLEWGSGAGFVGGGWLVAAYGDSGGDREMLAEAREAVHVGGVEVPA